MTQGWQKVRLGDVLSIKHGFAFSGSEFSEDRSYPALVTPGNFAIGGGFRLSKPKTFTGEVPEGYELSKGDLLITMTDLSKQVDTLGLPALVPGDNRYLHNQRIGLVEVSDTSRASTTFLNYFLRTAAYRNYIVGTASGSTVRHTSPSRIEDFRAVLPPLAEQQSIAEVLGALDDKIAANTKLASTADDVAISLFQEAVWKASSGSATFDDLAKVSGGGTPSTKVPDYWDGSVSWATPTDITSLSGPYLESTSRTITEHGLQNCSSELYPAGSILMTSRATIGAFAIAQEPTAVNQGFIVVEPHDVPMYWLFHEMRNRVDEFISMANGATFLELSRGNFKKFPVRLADARVMEAFASQAKGLHESARVSLLESNKLAEIRDNLLPHLMSGKLRVKDAERVVEGAV